MKRAVIIDDEKDFCLLLKNYLLKKDFEVETYSLLQQGMKAIEDSSPSVVFLDNNLPDGLGWAKVEELLEKYPQLRIHLLSGYNYSASSISSMKKVRIWQKPLKFAEMDHYFR